MPDHRSSQWPMASKCVSPAAQPSISWRQTCSPKPESILPLDFNYDFKKDLVLAGAGGVRFFRQDNPNTFTDVTAKSKLPKSVVNANYTGAWAVDIEADGDLDIGSPQKPASPLSCATTGDNTFTPIHPFTGISGLQQFVWADLDGDGDPDAALIDGSGKLHVLSDERFGQFRNARCRLFLPSRPLPLRM